MKEVQKGLGENQQKIFGSVHPVGTAKSVTVHDVTVTAWKGGKDTNRFEDVQEFNVRFTLYWRGPVVTDGFTKISETYDAESQRFTSFQVLATNGITNKDAGRALSSLVGTVLHYEAQKAGAEEAARDYYNNLAHRNTRQPIRAGVKFSTSTLRQSSRTLRTAVSHSWRNRDRAILGRTVGVDLKVLYVK